jgi:hypothetical protein
MGITPSRRSEEHPVDALAEEVVRDGPTITDAPSNRTEAEVSAWMGGCDLEMRRSEQGRGLAGTARSGMSWSRRQRDRFGGDVFGSEVEDQ